MCWNGKLFIGEMVIVYVVSIGFFLFFVYLFDGLVVENILMGCIVDVGCLKVVLNIVLMELVVDVLVKGSGIVIIVVVLDVNGRERIFLVWVIVY